MAKVTLSKGGKAEREAEVDEIEIPDLWHTAMRLKELGNSESDLRLSENFTKASEDILKTWHLAHDLKRHIQETS